MINNPPELAHYTKEKLTNCQYFSAEFCKFQQKKLENRKFQLFSFLMIILIFQVKRDNYFNLLHFLLFFSFLAIKLPSTL